MKTKMTNKMRAPDFRFNSPWQESLQFHDFLKDGGAVIFFLRYIGCPLCQLRISEIKRDLQKFEQKGVQVLVALQSEPENIRKISEEKDVPFTIICDPSEKIFGLYEVVPGSVFGYIAPDVILKALRARKEGFKHGIKEGKELQLPAVFIIDTHKKINYAYYGKNIGDVPGNEVVFKNIPETISTNHTI